MTQFVDPQDPNPGEDPQFKAILGGIALAAGFLIAVAIFWSK